MAFVSEESRPATKYSLVGAANSGFAIDDHVAAEESIDEFLRRIPMHEPGEGQLQRKVCGDLLHCEALMRNGRPPHAKGTRRAAHPHTAEEVVNPAFFKQRVHSARMVSVTIGLEGESLPCVIRWILPSN